MLGEPMPPADSYAQPGGARLHKRRRSQLGQFKIQLLKRRHVAFDG